LRRIVNASSLILLSKVSRLDLLRLGVADVVTPDTVIAETGVNGSKDPTAVAIGQTIALTSPQFPIGPLVSTNACISFCNAWLSS
jgi:hypothetical protein